jgi:predicted transcriptional regulator
MSTTQTLKLELMEWLATVHDKSLIKELAKWKEDHQRISVEQYNKELDEAEDEIDRGEFLTHEEAVKEIRSWR